MATAGARDLPPCHRGCQHVAQRCELLGIAARKHHLQSVSMQGCLWLAVSLYEQLP